MYRYKGKYKSRSKRKNSNYIIARRGGIRLS